MILRTGIALHFAFALLTAQQDSPQKPPIRVDIAPPEFKLGDGPTTTVLFTGEKYNGIELLPRQVSLDPDPHVRFVSEYIRANLMGKDDDLTSFWHPDDRAAITKLASDPKVLEKNRRHMESVSRWFLLARIQYGSFTFFLLSQIFRDKQVLPNIFPTKFEKNRYWLTNRLQGDPMFQYLSRSVALQFQNELLAKRPELLK